MTEMTVSAAAKDERANGFFPAELDAAQRLCFGTDGWPVVPVTQAGIERMLAAVAEQPGEVLGAMPPSRRPLTVYDVAVSALRAGCLPEYLPVVLAGARALADPRLNIHGALTHTAGTAPLLIVNGPIREQLDFNSSYAVFGPGWRANATVGRAIRLLARDVGGATAGLLDNADFGHPGKHTYCIAENEEASPWDALHVERGLRADQGAVTMFPCQAPYQVANNVAQSGEAILATIADSMARLGVTNLLSPGEYAVAIGVEHARTLSEQDWTKDQVKEFLAQHARRSVRDIKRSGLYPRLRDADGLRDDDDRAVASGAHDILLFVTGGPVGRYSAVFSGRAGHHNSRSVTIPVDTSAAQAANAGRAGYHAVAPVASGRNEIPPAVRPPSLQGLRIGLVDNSKTNAGVIVEHIAESLSQDYGASVSFRHRKPSSSLPLDEGLVPRFLEQCDVVVNGVGDCGSSSSTTVHDGILLESRGLPAVTICTERFEKATKAMARICDMPSYETTFIAHPMANLTKDEAQARAKAAVHDVVRRLVAV